MEPHVDIILLSQMHNFAESKFLLEISTSYIVTENNLFGQFRHI